MHGLFITRPLLIIVAAGALTAIAPGQALGDPASHPHSYAAATLSPARPDDRAGVRGIGVPRVPGYRQTSTAHGLVSTGIRPDDKAGPRGINPSTIAIQPVAIRVRPDDRAGVRGIGTAHAIANLRERLGTGIRPDDRAGPRGIGFQETARPLVATGKVGFDWFDAGVGAGGTFALIAFGTFLVATRRQRRGVPTPVLQD